MNFNFLIQFFIKNIVKQSLFYNITIFTTACAAIFNMSPYIMWQDHIIFKNLWAISLVSSIILLLLLIFKEPHHINKKMWFLSLPILLFLLKMCFSLRYDGQRNLKYTALFLLFFIFSILDKRIILDTYEKYKKILSLIFFISIIFYFCTIFGILDKKSFYKINHVNSLKENYLSCYFLVIEKAYLYNISDNFIYTRFSSIFDEPGLVGTVCALILAGEQLSLRKKENIVFLLSGLLSMSMFFILTILPFTVLNFRKNLLKIKAISIFSFLSCLIFYTYPEMRKKFYDITVGRFFSSAQEGGNIFYSRESIDLSLLFENFSHKDFFIQLLGMGEGAVEKICPGSSVYKILIINQGYIGLFLIILHIMIPIIYYFNTTFKNKNFYNKFFKSYLILFIVNILNIYQRPNIWTFYLFLIYFGSFYSIYFDYLNFTDKEKEIKKVS